LYIKVTIHNEQDKASELSQYSSLKNMKNQLFNLKAVQTHSYKAEVGAGAKTF
jgi:hypothetical protein